DLPIFSVEGTPSVIGAISEKFRRYPGVVRSRHASHSLTCMGPMAKAICEGHERCATPCGSGTPYAKLLAMDGVVLLFGVKLDSYTLFHTAEDEAAVPYQYYVEPFRYVLCDQSGSIRGFRTRRQNMNVLRRFRSMENWFENRKF